MAARKSFCVCEFSKEFQKKWNCNLKEKEMKWRNLLLKEYCNKPFSLMNSLWVNISGKCIDIC